MTVLKNSSNRHRELFVALGALIQASANFFLFIRLDFPDALSIGIFAMRTNNTMRPAYRLKVFAGGFIRVEPLANFIQRQISGVDGISIFMPQISHKAKHLSSA